MSGVRTRFAPDHRLTTRMALTVFLLGLLYVLFAVALAVLLKSVVLVVLIAGGLLAAQYWFSDRIALAGMRARLVDEREQPRLHELVDRLCVAADMPKPRIAVADTRLPNAFATGRNADHAVLCVTTGLLSTLDTDELNGVLAHELSHVAHRDVAVMTVASFLGVLAGLIARFSLYGGMFGRGRRDNAAVVVLLVLAVSAVVYALSYLLIRTLSRYRELAADRSGAMLTGRPAALASALTKVSGGIAAIPTRDLRTVEPFNALFIAPAIGSGLATLMSTHPPLEVRVRRLAELSRELGRAG